MNQALTLCLAQSVAVQANGTGDSMEVVTLPASLSGTDGEGRRRRPGRTSSAVATPTLDLRWRRANAVDTTTRAGSLNPDSNYTGGPRPRPRRSTRQNAGGALEPYSTLPARCHCRSPPNVLAERQDPASVSPGPLGGAAGGPAWAAADNVTVSGVGGFGSPFTGTSAAGPTPQRATRCSVDTLNNASAPPRRRRTARLQATAVDIRSRRPGQRDRRRTARLPRGNERPARRRAEGPYSTPKGTTCTLDGSARAIRTPAARSPDGGTSTRTGSSTTPRRANPVRPGRPGRAGHGRASRPPTQRERPRPTRRRSTSGTSPRPLHLATNGPKDESRRRGRGNDATRLARIALAHDRLG